MKYIKLFIVTIFVSVLTIGCNRDLPYPLDDVKKGVVVDIVRSAGSDGTLSNGETSGNYKVTLTIPKQQGDYSHLDHVQLLCVFTDKQGHAVSKVIEDNITEFPKEITLNVADIYSKFGLTAPSLGEVCEITTNAILKDGYVVYGWNEYSGFNNKAFTGWLVDDRNYSYRVRYPVVCQLVLEEFEGTLSLTDPFYQEDVYDVTCSKVSDTELAIEGFFEDDVILKIIVDPATYTVTIPKQVLFPSFGSYTNFSIEGSGTIDACNGVINFTATCTVDQGSFGSANFVLKI